jgi:hypothetical protein
MVDLEDALREVPRSRLAARGHLRGLLVVRGLQGGGLHERLVQPEEFCWLDRQDAESLETA